MRSFALKFIALLFTALIPQLLFGQLPLPYEIREDAVQLNKKNVKEVHVLMSDFERGAPDTLEVRKYDENGRITAHMAWDEYEMVFTHVVYEYGANGLLSSRREMDDYGDVWASTKYLYDGDQLLREQHTSIDGDYEVVYKYDDEGFIDSSFVLEAEVRRNAWYYNGDDLVDSIVGFTVFDYDQPSTWERVDVQAFEYDKKGRPLFDAFCGIYTGCYTHEYSLKKKLPVLEVVKSNEEEVYRVATAYRKKLPVEKRYTANPEMVDRPDEIHRYIYTYY